MALCVHGSICGYKHDWAPAASNKDTVAMGFNVRRTAMVDFHIHGRLDKKWFGLGLAVSVPDNETVKKQRPGSAGVGSGWLGHREDGEFGRLSRGAWEINRAASKLWLGLAWLGLVSAGVGGVGGRGGLPHTPDPMAGCDVQLLWHFVCVCGAMALCVHGSVGGGLGERGRLAPSPPSTHLIQLAGFDAQLFVAFCLCLWSDGTVCTWEHLRLQTRLGTRCVK